jgi:23S rRNA (cytidine1920-2'-O)/16S rRNA (cytidine1409-2'-O)-methyltransferase
MQKKRADRILFEQNLAESQDVAARLIMAGRVFLEASGRDGRTREERVDKPGRMLRAEAALRVRGREPYVSRGAYKLLTALERFRLEVAGLVALDAGASTGGFTDLLLQRGAARVYAVDVGHNQLHEKLRADSRVISLESTNLRLAGPELLPESVDLVVADVSFISLKAVLPACLQFLKPGGAVIALIKPQFEVAAGKTVKGVVRDPASRQAAVDSVLGFAGGELGLGLQGVIPAAIKGPKGNQEFLAYWRF